jgi:Fe-Mn family superoxide dismutase
MSQKAIDRRGVLKAGGLASASALLATPAGAATGGKAPIALKPFSAQPLPFDPKSIVGLSEKLLLSHHANNYTGAVKRLGAIKAEFAGLDPAAAPGFMINGLKREELLAWNSMILHELYFSGLGTPTRPGKALAAAIERDFGSDSRWRSEFVGMGKALGGGSGWVLLTYSHRDDCLVNQWANDHTMTLAGGTPILALDMYEHAYAMDYGTKAGAYVDAFMGAVNWAAADRLFGKTAGRSA